MFMKNNTIWKKLVKLHKRSAVLDGIRGYMAYTQYAILIYSV
jgi:hypothetical protein